MSLWLGLSGLLVVARGEPEAFLLATFGRFCRDDAFENLNRVSVVFWWLHSLLVVVAIAATWYRRTDVLTVLMIGPALALVIALLGERWADQNWFLIVAVSSICWLVSTFVGVIYYIVKRGEVWTATSLQQTGPAASCERIKASEPPECDGQKNECGGQS